MKLQSSRSKPTIPKLKAPSTSLPLTAPQNEHHVHAQGTSRKRKAATPAGKPALQAADTRAGVEEGPSGKGNAVQEVNGSVSLAALEEEEEEDASMFKNGAEINKHMRVCARLVFLSRVRCRHLVCPIITQVN
eukprot:336025-Pelagomonas_calceolata.AAC.15